MLAANFLLAPRVPAGLEQVFHTLVLSLFPMAHYMGLASASRSPLSTSVLGLELDWSLALNVPARTLIPCPALLDGITEACCSYSQPQPGDHTQMDKVLVNSTVIPGYLASHLLLEASHH